MNKFLKDVDNAGKLPVQVLEEGNELPHALADRLFNLVHGLGAAEDVRVAQRDDERGLLRKLGLKQLRDQGQSRG